MREDYEELGHGHVSWTERKCLCDMIIGHCSQDHSRSSVSEANLVQAPADSACYQEGQGRCSHSAFYPARQVVHQREEDGRVCGVCNHG